MSFLITASLLHFFCLGFLLLRFTFHKAAKEDGDHF